MYCESGDHKSVNFNKRVKNTNERRHILRAKNNYDITAQKADKVSNCTKSTGTGKSCKAKNHTSVLLSMLKNKTKNTGTGFFGQYFKNPAGFGRIFHVL